MCRKRTDDIKVFQKQDSIPIFKATHPVSAPVCLSVNPLSPLPESSWDRWAVWAGAGAASSCVADAGLLVSMGEPSNCDTLTAAGSDVSTMSGLREAVGEKKSYDINKRSNNVSYHQLNTNLQPSTSAHYSLDYVISSLLWPGCV